MPSFELEPDTIAHYHLQYILARGGMSLVYLAHDIHTKQHVAMKLVHKSEHDYYERFQREAHTLASLEHEHILPVLDYGEHASWFYMTMPYIEQGSLRDRLAKGTLPLQEAETILMQLVDAVQYAHDRGIVHRDIKPSNILLRDGKHVYLADFGLVKHMEEMSDLTQTNCILGTPEYMAPELTERPATVSSDVYAIGVVLYYMLTGRVPFKSNTPLGIYWKHLHEQPVAPSTYNQALSLATDLVILRALAKEPEQRFQSAKAFLEAYQASRKDEHKVTMSVVKASPTRPSTIIRRPLTASRKNRIFLYRAMNLRVGALLILAASLLFLVPILLHFSLSYGYDRPQPLLLNASNLTFRNHIATTMPTVQPTLTGGVSLTTRTTPNVSNTSAQKSINISSTLPLSHTNGSNSQSNNGGNTSDKQKKHKYKHTHKSKDD